MRKASATRKVPVTILCRGVVNNPNLPGIVLSCYLLTQIIHFLTETRVNNPIKQRDADENEDGVDHLKLVGEDGHTPGVAVHPHGLDGPLGALLVKKRPVHRVEEEEEADPVDRLEVVYVVHVVLVAGRLQPVASWNTILPPAESVLRRK